MGGNAQNEDAAPPARACGLIEIPCGRESSQLSLPQSFSYFVYHSIILSIAAVQTGSKPTRLKENIRQSSDGR